MSRLGIYARSLTANWTAFLANLLVAFFLAPFVLRSLGDAAYGVWDLLIQLTGYLGLIELGTQAGLGRHINFYLGRGEGERVNGFVNTALAFFLVAGAGILLLSLGLAAVFPALFPKVPPELVAAARPTLVLVAANLVLALLGAVFPLVLTAFDRFDLSNAVNLAVLALRTSGTVLVLRWGGGLWELACVQLGASAAGLVLGAVLARRVFPSLRLGLRLASMQRFRELFGFSIWAFVAQVGMQLLYLTSTILITMLIGPAAVPYFAYPMMLIQYGRGIVDNMAGVLGPQTIKASSVGDHLELRRLFSWGSKVIMFVAIPLFGGLAVLGEPFLVLWLGERFHQSGAVLVLLVIPQWVVMAIRPGVNIIMGLGHVRFAGLMTLGQGVVNLALTLAYVQVLGMGLAGIALGLLVPIVAFNTVIAFFVLRWIGLSGMQFLAGNVARYVATTAAFVGGALLVRHVPAPDGWPWFFAKAAVLAALALPLGWYGIFSAPERRELGGRIRGLIRRRRSGDGATPPPEQGVQP